MAGLGACDVADGRPLHPKDEMITEVLLRYAEFRE